MQNETIGVTVTYKEPVTFHLRMIGMAEEKELRQKVFGIPEAEKTEKQYQANVDLLASLSEALPEGMFPNKPKTTPVNNPTTYIEDFDGADSGKAIRKYFEVKTILKERIAEYAVRGYFLKLQPDVSFL